MPGADRMALLERIREHSGASLGACQAALRVSGDDARAALNLLASQGHVGGRVPYDDAEEIGCYELDAYAERVRDASVSAVRSYLRPGDEPAGAVVLYAQDGLPVSAVALTSIDRGRTGRARVLVDVAADRGLIPADFGEDDRSLQAFRYRFGFQQTRPDVGTFDEEPSLAWQEDLLPTCLFIYEMMQAARAVASLLAQTGLPVAPDCGAGFVQDDVLFSDPEDQLNEVRSELRKHLPAGSPALQAFARLCYRALEKQKWLAGIAAEAIKG